MHICTPTYLLVMHLPTPVRELQLSFILVAFPFLPYVSSLARGLKKEPPSIMPPLAMYCSVCHTVYLLGAFFHSYILDAGLGFKNNVVPLSRRWHYTQIPVCTTIWCEWKYEVIRPLFGDYSNISHTDSYWPSSSSQWRDCDWAHTP